MILPTQLAESLEEDDSKGEAFARVWLRPLAVEDTVLLLPGEPHKTLSFLLLQLLFLPLLTVLLLEGDSSKELLLLLLLTRLPAASQLLQ